MGSGVVAEEIWWHGRLRDVDGIDWDCLKQPVLGHYLLELGPRGCALSGGKVCFVGSFAGQETEMAGWERVSDL